MSDERYFIVDRDSLGQWGHERGVDTLEEVNQDLKESDPDMNLVVIYGVKIPTTRRVAIHAKESTE